MLHSFPNQFLHHFPPAFHNHVLFLVLDGIEFCLMCLGTRIDGPSLALLRSVDGCSYVFDRLICYPIAEIVSLNERHGCS